MARSSALLGCKAVRVNLHGKGNPDNKMLALIDSLGRPGEMGKSTDLNVVVENHGSEFSKGFLGSRRHTEVNPPNAGALATTQGQCKDAYDRIRA